MDNAKQFIEDAIKSIREEVGKDNVVLALSGGVDSTVVGTLLNKAIGSQLHCIFVNHGLLRKGEFDEVLGNYRKMGLNVKGVDASLRYYDALKGVTDPEQKRKIIGKLFIDIFEEEARQIENVKWLGQGTIYPDILESKNKDGKMVKSHHNVGGLPEKMNLKLIEPVKLLYKNEVREVGKELGIAPELIGRHPFPGPGLGVRCVGEITAERIKVLQNADDVFIRNLRAAGLYEKVWQAGAILLPVQTVGVRNNERTYESAVVLRAVHSTNAMTADVIPLPYDFLNKVAKEIIETVPGVNRVLYDISPKPPATIEFE